MNLSARNGTPAPSRKKDHCRREHNRLPDREMERFEPHASMASDEKKRGHANQIDRLNQEDAEECGDETLAGSGGKREDSRHEKEHCLEPVAAILNVDCKAWRGDDRATHDNALTNRPQQRAGSCGNAR